MLCAPSCRPNITFASGIRRGRIQHNFSREEGGSYNSGQGTLGVPVHARLQSGAGTQTEVVKTVALADVIPLTEDVALLKLDVEGCECHCLQSAEPLFAAGRIKAVYIETDGLASKHCGCKARWLISFFRRHSFVVCPEFEGTAEGESRSCKQGVHPGLQSWDDIDETEWFNPHDRFLRLASSPPFPGRPLVGGGGT